MLDLVRTLVRTREQIVTKRKYPTDTRLPEVTIPQQVSVVACPSCGRRFKPRGLGKHYAECAKPKVDVKLAIGNVKAKLGI